MCDLFILRRYYFRWIVCSFTFFDTSSNCLQSWCIFVMAINRKSSLVAAASTNRNKKKRIKWNANVNDRTVILFGYIRNRFFLYTIIGADKDNRTEDKIYQQNYACSWVEDNLLLIFFPYLIKRNEKRAHTRIR